MSRETTRVMQHFRSRKMGALITPRPERTEMCVEWTSRQELWPWVERHSQQEATAVSGRELGK